MFSPSDVLNRVIVVTDGHSQGPYSKWYFNAVLVAEMPKRTRFYVLICHFVINFEFLITKENILKDGKISRKILKIKCN